MNNILIVSLIIFVGGCEIYFIIKHLDKIIVSESLAIGNKLTNIKNAIDVIKNDTQNTNSYVQDLQTEANAKKYSDFGKIKLPSDTLMVDSEKQKVIAISKKEIPNLIKKLKNVKCK